jgi:hypothetical protein
MLSWAVIAVAGATTSVPAWARRTTPAVMLLGKRAPPEIYQKLKPTNSGTGRGLASVSEIDAIWSAFESAYGSRDRALEASRRNSQVLLPFINRPSTISGAHAVLVQLFGKAGALDIITKNPGVLACNPASLARASKQDIINAANLVNSIDTMPPNIKSGIPFLTLLAIVGAVGTRLVQCGGGGVCGTAAEWDLQGGLGPSFVRAVSGLMSG